MKKKYWLCGVLLLGMAGLFAFTRKQETAVVTGQTQTKTAIRGTVKPLNGALHVWAVSDSDTSSATVVNGQFKIENLKGGLYRVIAEGIRPYKVTTKTGVNVNPGTSVDVGEIVLDQ